MSAESESSGAAEEVSLGRAVAVASLAPIAERLADEHEREEREAEGQRQLKEALAALPPLERPTLPKTWVGEPWSPGRVIIAVLWVLGATLLWSIPLVIGGAIVVAIFFGGNQIIMALVDVLGIGAAMAIAAREPVKGIREETARRHRMADEKAAYERAVKAFDAREAERTAIQAKFGEDSR